MTAENASRVGSRSGFTLIEMMFALAILAVGLLAMLTAQLSALKQGKYGRHATEAAQVARDQMEYLLRLPWADAAAQPTNWTVATPVSLKFQDDSGQVQQQVFDISWRIQTAAFSADIRTVDVRVLWTEAEAAAGAPTRRYVISSNKNNG